MRRILFSGDVGRYGAVLTRDPDPACEADYLVVESTYGNRLHPGIAVKEQLEGVLQRTFARGGVLLVPAFAVGRTQQLIFLMDELVSEGRMRPFPIHVDSPMAIHATRVYSAFPEAHRVSLQRMGGGSLLSGKWVQSHPSRQESQALNEMRGPAVILAGSGMLSGGRILHHCRVRLPKPENTLMIAGYQAQGTLGRALLEGAKVVRIHKGDVPVLAEITELKGMSGHADATELLRWLSEVKAPRRVFLTHGEEEAALPLAARIAKERGFETHVPEIGESVGLE
jgi:metallo-beta-lactamase family protein